MKEQHSAGSSELLDALADAYLRAEIPASRSPEYEALAEAVGYAVDLADRALVAEAEADEEPELRGHRSGLTLSIGASRPELVAAAFGGLPASLAGREDDEVTLGRAHRPHR